MFPYAIIDSFTKKWNSVHTYTQKKNFSVSNVSAKSEFPFSAHNANL